MFAHAAAYSPQPVDAADIAAFAPASFAAAVGLDATAPGSSVALAVEFAQATPHPLAAVHASIVVALAAGADSAPESFVHVLFARASYLAAAALFAPALFAAADLAALDRGSWAAPAAEDAQVTPRPLVAVFPVSIVPATFPLAAFARESFVVAAALPPALFVVPPAPVLAPASIVAAGLAALAPPVDVAYAPALLPAAAYPPGAALYPPAELAPDLPVEDPRPTVLIAQATLPPLAARAGAHELELILALILLSASAPASSPAIPQRVAWGHAEIALLPPSFAVDPIPIAAFAQESFVVVVEGRIALAASALDLVVVDPVILLDCIGVAAVAVAVDVAFVADTASAAQESFVDIALAYVVVVVVVLGSFGNIELASVAGIAAVVRVSSVDIVFAAVDLEWYVGILPAFAAVDIAAAVLGSSVGNTLAFAADIAVNIAAVVRVSSAGIVLGIAVGIAESVLETCAAFDLGCIDSDPVEFSLVNSAAAAQKHPASPAGTEQVGSSHDWIDLAMNFVVVQHVAVVE